MSIPRIDALYDALCARWLDHGRRPFRASHRELADEIGCSAGHVHTLIQQLLAEESIIRTPRGNSYTFDIPDRNDQSGDRSDQSAPENADRIDQSAAPVIESIRGRAPRPDAAQALRPPRSPHARASSESGGGDHDLLKTPPPTESLTPARAKLDQALRADDCNLRLCAEILAANPTLTLAEYQEQRTRIPPGFGIGLLFDKLRVGQRLPPLHTATDRAIDLDRQV
jgi:ADP-ribose pyrophosphatase YjhB (NUDIX family)